MLLKYSDCLQEKVKNLRLEKSSNLVASLLTHLSCFVIGALTQKRLTKIFSNVYQIKSVKIEGVLIFCARQGEKTCLKLCDSDFTRFSQRNNKDASAIQSVSITKIAVRH